MASSRLFILGLAMLVVALNLVTQTEGFNTCYEDGECKGEPISAVADCGQCLQVGGRSIHIALSLICKRCDVGVNACYRNKKCKPCSYITGVNDCDECLREGGKAMNVQLSLICKRCDLPTGIHPCYKSKNCKLGYITSVNDCDECVKKGGKAINISRSRKCKICPPI